MRQKKIFQIAFFMFCFLMAGNLQAQHTKNRQQAESIYEKAMQSLQESNMRQAIDLLQKTIQLDSNYIEAYLSLGGVYGEQKNYEKAIQFFEKAKQKDSAAFSIFQLSYSINLAGAGKFKEALQAVNSFLKIPGLNERSIQSALYRKQCYEFAINFNKKVPSYSIQPINLGDSINSSASEYYPSLTLNDSLLVFTQRGEGIRENFMQSKKLSTGFSKATLISGSLNEQPSKGALHISQDGAWLLFAGNFPQNNFGNFDLYISYYTLSGWSEPLNLGDSVNTEFWESSPSLSSDKTTLYFSSDRPGGYGGKDLYVSYRQSNGQWGRPINMGASINTGGDELAPFIHADNETLYFTSNGLPGYGNTDLYMIKKDTAGNWERPQNLGYPINTIDDEGSLFIAANGSTTYYASDRSDTRGGLDLYTFEMPQAFQPLKTLFVQGYVYDAVTKKGIPCAVNLYDNATQRLLFHLQTDETGFYLIPLPINKQYTFIINRKGYLFYSDTVNVTRNFSDSGLYKNIYLQPLQVNASIVLKNIQFAFNSYELQPVSFIELDKVVELLKENKTLQLQINGHTDSIGNEDFNKHLSLLRAKAVADYLISKGIEASRLKWQGFGSSQPIADNNTEEGRAMNRRTEIKITGL